MARWTTLVIMLCGSSVVAAQPSKQSRTALLIGAEKYRDGTVPDAAQHARLLGARLEELGFDVRVEADPGVETLRQTIQGWIGSLKPNAMAFFYYEGRMVSIAGKDYLLPAGKGFADSDDSYAVDLRIGAREVIDGMAGARAYPAIAVLNACHNTNAEFIPFKPAYFYVTPGISNDGGALPSKYPVCYGGLAGILAEELRSRGRSLATIFSRVDQNVLYASDNKVAVGYSVSTACFACGDLQPVRPRGAGTSDAASSPTARPQVAPVKQILNQPAKLSRKALLIGNEAYRDSVVEGAKAHARLLGDRLKAIGFDVRVETDLDGAKIRPTIKSWLDGLGPSDMALFYYEGLAMQIKNKDYFLPAGGSWDDSDGMYARESRVGIKEVINRLGAIHAGSKIAGPKIAILNVCHNRPAEFVSTTEIYVGWAIRHEGGGTPSACSGKVAEVLSEQLRQPQRTVTGIFAAAAKDLAQASSNNDTLTWSTAGADCFACDTGPAVTQGQQAPRGATLFSALPRTAGPGRYHALVVGIGRYTTLPGLKTAVADAASVEAILRQGFGFESEVLLNATRAQILDALNRYRQTLRPDDSLLIYFAGHGYRDINLAQAYWLPADADANKTTNWISADDITTNVRAMAARHVLIVSDSCYSGTLSRAAPVRISSGDPDQALANIASRTSRILLASGGNEPVADGRGDGVHSVFATVFLSALSEIRTPRFTVEELFMGIRERVAGRSTQVPECNPLRNSNHDGGTFIFERKVKP